MDEAPGTDRRPGGNVEPLSRATAGGNPAPIADLPDAPRFELRDPFAEVTYRSNSFDDMARKADRLGALRFVAIAPDGKRTTVAKEGGDWPRPALSSEALAALRSEAPTENAPAARSSSDRAEAALTKIDADAQRAARVAQLEAELNDRYLIKRAPLRIGSVTIGQTEYRHRGDTSRVAFTESTFRLSTETNSPSVARSMVDVAEARDWQALRVSGNEDFRRMVWLEASLRNVRTIGYEPVPGDHELLRKEREARQLNRIERQDKAATTTARPKESSRGGSRKAVLAALEAVLVARHVPQAQRAAVMAAAAEQLSERLRRGETHRVKVYDPTAPSQRTLIASTRERPRERERSAPTR